MKKVHHLLLVLAMAVALGGCFKTYIVSGAPYGQLSQAENDKWHHSLLFGLIPLGGDVKLREVCPQGWAEIQVEKTFLNSLTSAGVQAAISFGANALLGQSVPADIWSTQNVTVRCAGGAAFNARIDATGQLLAVAPHK